MFGYVRPYPPELRIREYEYYRATYCGLCRAMKQTTGYLSAATLNYDVLFLVLVRLLYDEKKITVTRRRCLMHPFRRHAEAAVTESFRVGARCAALLAAAKCRDDLSDEKGFRRFRAVCLAPFLAHAEKRAAMPELQDTLSDILRRLSIAEVDPSVSLDARAELSGEMLSAVFRAVCPADSPAPEIGRIVGRIVYKTDALCDFPDDVRESRPNPYIPLYGKTLTDENREEIRRGIRLELPFLEKEIDALPLGDDAEIRSIIDNILYVGLSEQSIADQTKS